MKAKRSLLGTCSKKLEHQISSTESSLNGQGKVNRLWTTSTPGTLEMSTPVKPSRFDWPQPRSSLRGTALMGLGRIFFTIRCRWPDRSGLPSPVHHRPSYSQRHTLG